MLCRENCWWQWSVIWIVSRQRSTVTAWDRGICRLQSVDTGDKILPSQIVGLSPLLTKGEVTVWLDYVSPVLVHIGLGEVRGSGKSGHSQIFSQTESVEWRLPASPPYNYPLFLFFSFSECRSSSHTERFRNSYTPHTVLLPITEGQELQSGNVGKQERILTNEKSSCYFLFIIFRTMTRLYSTEGRRGLLLVRGTSPDPGKSPEPLGEVSSFKCFDWGCNKLKLRFTIFSLISCNWSPPRPHSRGSWPSPDGLDNFYKLLEMPSRVLQWYGGELPHFFI